MGVTRLEVLNATMLHEKEGLWCRVLKACYGEVWGQVLEGGRHVSSWWRSVCRVREGLGESVGRWFDDNIRRVVGDGRNAFFWHDNWVGDIPLRCKFPRLFDLAVRKKCFVEEMSRVG
jgi:hypothetical protein